MASKQKEVRFTQKASIRATGAAAAGNTAQGYAVVFDSLSCLLPDAQGRAFREKIAPGAFSMSLAGGDDIRALVDHNHEKLLGRTSSGTLRLREDNVGLRFEIDMPNTSVARDLSELINRGDVSGCSFGMYVMDEEWDNTGSIRTVTDAEIFEMSIVSMPAYEASSVALRSLFPDGVPQSVANRNIVTPVMGFGDIKANDPMAQLRAKFPDPSQLSDEDYTVYAKIRLALTSD
jgi:HK97 family phage prohead protease